MFERPTRAAIIAIAATAYACDPVPRSAADGAGAVTVPDSAGIEIVENHAPEHSAGDFWTIDPEPEIVLGGEENPTRAAWEEGTYRIAEATGEQPPPGLFDGMPAPEFLPPVNGLVVDSEGLLWVWEWTESQTGLPNRWSVHTSDGRWLGVVADPLNPAPVGLLAGCHWRLVGLDAGCREAARSVSVLDGVQGTASRRALERRECRE